MQKKIKVVIEHATRWDYFQWFILGFYELAKEGKIDFQIKVPLKNYIQSNVYTNYLFFTKLKLIKEDSYNLKGYILTPEGLKKYFCIDSADSPYLFHSEDLEKADCYFKMQCPKDLEKDYFALNHEVHMPWLNHLHVNETTKCFIAKSKGERRFCENFKENKEKIKPLIVGPRRLASGISYHQLKRGYQNYRSALKLVKEKKVMCYFGNAKGPTPLERLDHPDFDSEANLLGYFKTKLSHPNEKRAKVAAILKSLGKDYDGRIIKDENGKHAELAVPLEDFCDFISNFQYNFNVSGYRLSMPSRFIESFMVGTGIITDKLAVKWYLPFTKEEIVETCEMGYLKDKDVDWDQVKKDILNLKASQPQKIIAAFEEKWAPRKVAQYIIKETLKKDI